MKSTLIVILLLSALNSSAQKKAEIDSISNEICNSIALSNEKVDSIRIIEAFDKHLKSYFTDFGETQRMEIWDNIFFRLQRNCKLFDEILRRNSPPNENWETVTERPQAKLKNKDCLEFRKYKYLKYIEPTGDTTNLEINKGFWTDNFKDGTYSKLKLNWVNECTFDIEFIESNNDVRKNFSNPGDKYRYTIIDKAENYFLMYVEIVGIDKFSLFKIYY